MKWNNVFGLSGCIINNRESPSIPPVCRNVISVSWKWLVGTRNY